MTINNDLTGDDLTTAYMAGRADRNDEIARLKAELAEARKVIEAMLPGYRYASECAGRAFYAMMEPEEVAREVEAGKKMADIAAQARAFLARKGEGK